MPPRKSTKNNSSAAQRKRKPKAQSPEHIEVPEDGFDLSAYLCECSLVTSSKTLEDLAIQAVDKKSPHKIASHNNLPKEKKLSIKGAHLKNGINSHNDSTIPESLCESTLETGDLPEMCQKGSLKNDKLEKKKSKNKNNCSLKIRLKKNPPVILPEIPKESSTTSGMHRQMKKNKNGSYKIIYNSKNSKRQINSKLKNEKQVFLQPDNQSTNSSKSSLELNVPKKRKLEKSKNDLKMNKENSLGHGLDAIFFCESVIQSKEAPICLSSNISKEGNSKEQFLKTSLKYKGRIQQNNRKTSSNNQVQEYDLEKLRRNNINISLVPVCNTSMESSSEISQKKVCTRQPKRTHKSIEINNKSIKLISTNHNKSMVQLSNPVILESQPSLGNHILDDSCKVNAKQRKSKQKCYEVIRSITQPKIIKGPQNKSAKQCVARRHQSTKQKIILGKIKTDKPQPKNTSNTTLQTGKPVTSSKTSHCNLSGRKVVSLKEINVKNKIPLSNINLGKNKKYNKTQPKRTEKSVTSSEKIQPEMSGPKDISSKDVNTKNEISQGLLRQCKIDRTNLIMNLGSMDVKSNKKATVILQSEGNTFEKNKTTNHISDSPVTLKPESKFKENSSEFSNDFDSDDHSIECDANSLDSDPEICPSDNVKITFGGKNICNDLKTHHQREKELCKEGDQISFIECNFFENNLTLVNPLALGEDGGKIIDNDTEDPLMCSSSELQESGCHKNKDVNLEDNPLEHINIKNSPKNEILNCSLVHDLESDLKVDFFTEKIESLSSNSPELKNESSQDQLEANVSKFDPKDLQSFRKYSLVSLELKYDFELMPGSPESNENIINEHNSCTNAMSKNQAQESDSVTECLGLMSSLFNHNSSTNVESKNQPKENDSPSECLGLMSSLFDSGKSIYLSSPKAQFDINLNNSTMSSQANSNVLTTSAKEEANSKTQEFLTTTITNQEQSEMNFCPLQDSIIKDGTNPKNIEHQQSMPSSLLFQNNDCEKIENSSYLGFHDQKCPMKNTDGCGESLRNIIGIKDLKKMVNFQERILKVLLYRLEDQEIFKDWKKNGLVSSLKNTYKKQGQLQKNTLIARTISRNRKVKTSFKCGVCKINFRRRDRYWEHRASKCDTMRVFGCHNCNNKYILKKMLDDHVEKCISVKYYRCQRCSKLFNNQERLDEHNASKCDTQEAFECDECGRRFIYKRLLLIHTTPICTSLRRHKCSICLQSILKEDSKAHRFTCLEKHGLGPSKFVLCEFCGKLVTRNHFSAHMNTHVGHALYQCRTCKSTFQSEGARDHHYREQHQDETSYVCADCEKVFSSLHHLKKHVIAMGNLYNCKTCGKVFRNLSCLRGHERKHVTVKAEDCSNDTPQSQIKQEPLDEEIWHHALNIFDEKILKPIKFEEISPENIILEKNSQIDKYTSIIEINPGISEGSIKDRTTLFKCEKCVCSFSLEKDLVDHVQQSHGVALEVKPFKCKTCGTTFKCKNYLNRHCRRVHGAPFKKQEIVRIPTAEKPYACDVCQICFSNRNNLKRHKQRMHDFSNKINVKEEHDSKTGQHYNETPNVEKKHTCDICGKKFEKFSNLRRHQSYLHGIQSQKYIEALAQDKSYLCNICGKKFGRRENLNRHRKKMHQRLSNSILHLTKTNVKNEDNSTEICDTKNHYNGTTEEVKYEDNSTTSYDTTNNYCGNPPNSYTQKEKFETTAGCDSENNYNGIPTQEEKYEDNSTASCDSTNGTPAHEQMYMCDICTKIFGRKRNLYEHRRRVHKIHSNDLFSCSFCNDKFKTNVELESHTFNHFAKGIPSSSCINKGDTSLSLSQFNHLDERSININYTKETVPNVISSNSVIETPKELSHFRDPAGTKNILDQCKPRHVCKECGKKFSVGFNPNRHVCLHKLSTLQRSIGREVHACQVCGVFFFEKSKLKKHLLTHTLATYECDVCRKLFTTQSKLNQHKLVHGVEFTTGPTFNSSVCNKMLPSSTQLMNHSRHHPKQLFSCKYTQCSKKFTTLWSMKRHVQSCHSDKPFSCKYCNMSFVSLSSLDQHVKYQHNQNYSLANATDVAEKVQEQSCTEANNLTLYNLQGDNVVYENLSNLFSNFFPDGNEQVENPSSLQQDSGITKEVTFNNFIE